MANAGCINAYDCNGCLIQTLQNLDSACIGVGVQYTAPNPLDDKRLDYIKYTDKCGCVQCLSAENEILIYATNGVIKNLTLTNDDVNEAIKIKWNDIFGSNRAKTIVRYKTGSYPVSITDGTLAVEETTKNQYSSTPFSLSGVLDETTYYISAFAVDSNGTIIDVQGMSITTSFRVYQEFNLSSTGYTNIYKSGYKIKNIEVQGTVGFSGRSQFYLRIHDATVNEGMYGYVFDYFNSEHRWELQLYSGSWSTLHTGSNNSISSSNTYSITMGKNSGEINVNGVATNITYTATEQTRVSTIFNGNSPYFYVGTYNGGTVSYGSVKVVVEYEKI